MIIFCYPPQLYPWVVLVYERAHLLQKHILALFGLDEIVCIRPTYNQLMNEKIHWII